MKQQTQLIIGAFIAGIFCGLLLALWWRIGQIQQNKDKGSLAYSVTLK